MLYIIRHGRTDWNEVHKMQGRTDILLNEKGREMAREAAFKYKDVHFDICYCSPLLRARETAELLLEGRNIPIITDERLREMSFGDYEGTIKDEQEENSPIWNFFYKPENYKAQNGAESFEELFLRTGEFLKECVEPELKSGKDIVIVGHGAMNSSIVCQVKNFEIKDFWKYPIKNCELIKLI